MEAILELDRVTVRRPGPDGGGHTLLDAVSLSLGRGERHCLIGRSGSGKSTLLRVANRLVEPDEGLVRFAGQPVTALSPRDLRRRAALVFQEPVWLPGTAADNLDAGVRLQGNEPDPSAREVAMELAGIESAWLDRTEDQLSTGQRQRIMLGRALLLDPDVLLLDEPSSSLDPPAAKALMAQLTALSERRNLAMLMVTHRMEDALVFSAVTSVLDAGRITARGPTRDVLAALDDTWR